MQRKRPGRTFEEAVFRFAKTLDPSADVLFDHKVKDRDTGEFRQCDVWINAMFGGHWLQSIIVSCKDHKRRVNAAEIGTFCDEKRSTGATMGVIYSRSGFTRTALQKASANQISCCRLYENEPADLPPSVWMERFACKSSFQIQVLLFRDLLPHLKTWDDLFMLTDRESGKSLLDSIAEGISAGEKEALKEIDKLKNEKPVCFPPAWLTEFEIDVAELNRTLKLEALGTWRRYRGKSEATLISGSYCITNDSFTGTMVGPSLDTRKWPDGKLGFDIISDQWEELAPDEIPVSPKFFLLIFSGGDVRRALRDALGKRLLLDDILRL